MCIDSNSCKLDFEVMIDIGLSGSCVQDIVSLVGG